MAGGKSSATSTGASGEPSLHPMPIVDENAPGLGRNSRLLEAQRQASGGLTDDPQDDPSRDDHPFKITTHGASRGGEGK